MNAVLWLILLAQISEKDINPRRQVNAKSPKHKDTSKVTRLLKDVPGVSSATDARNFGSLPSSNQVCGYLQNWADAVIVRYPDITMLDKMAAAMTIPVINALTNDNHPCEMMSDLYALSKVRADYLKDEYLFVGADGNIGRAWKEASEALGFSLTQSSPAKYQISGIACNDNLKNALEGKDIICTDSISSNMIGEFKDYQISKDLMGVANKGAILNPCPPFYRGEEVTEDVIDSDYFVGYEFKQSLLKVQQAIMIYCLLN
ncbi:peptide transporter [Butyrivibrio sp. AC2005]|uniref:peptide transporter n=1 Tax=Butyrivibrio sp. AC2005 TaxID=1280672 RepID=UPI001FA70622